MAVGLKAVIMSASTSGVCSTQSTASELPVLSFVAPPGGMRGISGRSALPASAPALGADRAGIC
jgi:hypothetical protein